MARPLTGARLLAAVCGLTPLLLGTCVFPTEKDESVHVSLTPIKILFRGSDTVATAQAWQMMGATDSQPIPNVVFVWSSSDPSVATVDGSGRIVGVNSGTAIVTAAAANFDKDARPAADTIRVATPLEIDSIRPKTVKYGEVLTIYGVSVDSIISASLKDAGLMRVPFADTVYPTGTARSRWWVPPPAHTDSLFFLGITGGNGVLGYVHGDTTKVIEQDLFEPNDTVPTVLNLDAPPPFAMYPQIVFFNPALAFEFLSRGIGTDWYRLTHSGAPRDLTVILTAPQVKGTYATYITDSLAFNQTTGKFFIGANSWSFGPGSHFCHGVAFAPSEALGDSVIVAFKALPESSLHMLAGYGVPGRYGLGLVAGYQSELPADPHEDDNSCNAADRRDTVPAPFRDTLAIENPHDVDWIRFHYTQGPIGTTAQVRLYAFPGTHPDSAKDLDLYVMRIPNPGDPSIQMLAMDTTSGSDADLRPALATGDYYLAVVDYAGVATYYAVCVGTINTLLGTGTCATGFPAPPATAGVRRKRAAVVSPIAPSRR